MRQKARDGTRGRLQTPLMNLSTRLIIMFALVAIFATALTSYLSHQETNKQVRHFIYHGLDLGQQTRHKAGLEQRSKLLDNLRKSAIRAAIIALIVAIAVALYFAYFLTKPIVELTNITENYGSGQRDLRANEGKDKKYELNRLAKSFNNMANKISEEEEQKRRMTADIAHELRTPLAILKAELEALEDGILEPSPKVYQGLVKEVDFLEHLVNDLRLLSLAESGELKLDLVPLDLAELSSNVITRFRSKVKEKNISLKTNFVSSQITADADRLKQILINLMANAVRYSPQGGIVVVETKILNNSVRLTIDNDSEQVLPEKSEQLFERFYRTDSARNRNTGGMGLGLAIAKALADLHSAKLSIFNYNDGVRTELVFDLS